jgi:hypothetical protein
MEKPRFYAREPARRARALPNLIGREAGMGTNADAQTRHHTSARQRAMAPPLRGGKSVGKYPQAKVARCSRAGSSTRIAIAQDLRTEQSAEEHDFGWRRVVGCFGGRRPASGESRCARPEQRSADGAHDRRSSQEASATTAAGCCASDRLVNRQKIACHFPVQGR